MFRFLLAAFTLSLGATGVLMLVSILDANGLQTHGRRALESALALSVCFAFWLGALAVSRTPTLRSLAWISAAGTLIALAFVLALIFSRRATHMQEQIAWSVVTGAAGLAVTCGLLQVQLLGAWRLVRAAVVFFLAILVAGLIVMITADARPAEAVVRSAGAAAVLFGVGTVLVFIGRNLSRKAVIDERGDVTVLRCPHCGGDLPPDLAQVFQ